VHARQFIRTNLISGLRAGEFSGKASLASIVSEKIFLEGWSRIRDLPFCPVLDKNRHCQSDNFRRFDQWRTANTWLDDFERNN